MSYEHLEGQLQTAQECGVAGDGKGEDECEGEGMDIGKV
jgi:hypothetical protein